MKRLLAVLLAVPCLAFAQGYPAKPVRVILPFPPGGQIDLVGRIVQPRFQELLGQTVILETRAGAGGSVGAAEAARAVPDGYTLLLVFDSHAVNHYVYPSAPDPFRSFDHLVLMVTAPSVLVAAAGFPPGTLTEVVAHARTQAGRVTYATPGAGSSPHFGALRLEQYAGVRMTQVAYKGGGPMVQGLLGNQYDIAFFSVPVALPHVQSGRAKAIAVGSRQRVAQLPDVPTLADTYPGFEQGSWIGLVAPAGMARDVAEKVRAAMTRTLQTPEVRQRLLERGYEIVAGAPDEFLAFVREESDRLGKLIRENRIQAE